MVEVKLLNREEWDDLAQHAQLICFNEEIPYGFNNIDFCLLTVQGDTPLTFCTVRELDKESVYWQYGGAFPASEGTVHTWKSNKRNAEWCFNRGYKRITTYIENTNIPMLKIAFKTGFRIIGTRTFKGSIMVELILEKGD